MARRAESRFRRLPPPRLEPPARGPTPARRREAPGDLFDHFGIASERAGGLPAAIVAALACPTCAWLCRDDQPERVCPLCGAALPNSTQAG